MFFAEDRDRRQWDRIERGILAILKADHFIIHMGLKMSKELDDLTAEVAADTEVETSAIKLIEGLAAQIAAAGTDPAKLQALTAELTNSRDALAAAVKANTPATPVAPTVTGVSPNTGPAAGGTTVTISGTGFTAATGLAIGGTPVPSMTISSDTSITATTPAGTVGDATVVVSAGALASAPGVFTYTA